MMRNYIKAKYNTKFIKNKIFSCGNILATENQQARINDVIEVKKGVYLHKT